MRKVYGKSPRKPTASMDMVGQREAGYRLSADDRAMERDEDGEIGAGSAAPRLAPHQPDGADAEAGSGEPNGPHHRGRPGGNLPDHPLHAAGERAKKHPPDDHPEGRARPGTLHAARGGPGPGLGV